ncbi:hypothetical protein KGA66_13590 [Actinocrinis puniceicyclus]|uniref:Uncharacterized protein n=1 Tax=Actinocrinis puniceicyclus TaxID=977794 RepID=A0A8J7WNN5_9ACTN|nr:hypothetical protein [Actinocrinis puniceicyclus]MBS2964085.1 hypothetical protein [Actinocrinis puniceicyclus]
MISAVVIGTQGVISVSTKGEFARLEQENAGGLPAVAIIALVVCAIVGLISLATGAKQRTGFARRRAWIGLYACAALLSGIAGILTAINLQGVTATGDAALQEGEVIAALLVGGASLYGSRGGVASAFAGSAFVAVMPGASHRPYTDR